jgi:hypothetical protein
VAVLDQTADRSRRSGALIVEAMVAGEQVAIVHHGVVSPGTRCNLPLTWPNVLTVFVDCLIGAESMVNSGATTGKTELSWAQVRTEERERIAEQRERAENEEWMGLALSGGGIRSATFCLGVLQNLAAKGLLRHFDFMSSVSGGGYVAASLCWLWSNDKSTGTSASDFPYGSKLQASPTEERSILGYLRWHANYLAPGGGISIWSGVAVLVRTLVVSLLVWLPLGILCVVGLLALPPYIAAFARFLGAVMTKAQAAWAPPAPGDWFKAMPYFEVQVPLFSYWAFWGAVTATLLFFAAALLLTCASILVPPETRDNNRERRRRAMLCAVFGLAAAALGSFYFYRLSSEGYPLDRLDSFSTTIEIIAVAGLVFGFVAVTLSILQYLRLMEVGVNYTLRRCFDLYMKWFFVFTLVFVLLASLPSVYAALSATITSPESRTLFGALGLVIGAVSGLYGHFVQAQRVAPKYASRWAATIGSALFLYGLVMASYIGGLLYVDPAAYGVSDITAFWITTIFPAIVLFSLLLGAFSNLNHLGLHRFYRDRLMEAFLPTTEKDNATIPQYTDADRASIVDFWGKPVQNGRLLPYPIFNTNVILINEPSQKLALRGGDSFMLTPGFVGSSSTGWVKTSEHIAQHGPLTLASAMAISGAAANANAAYIGSGITRDRLISIVMMLLNMRLGVWLGSPKGKSGTPNYFSPGFRYGVLGLGYETGSDFVELTDGGHFDNLGVYELVRRRADVVFAMDAEEDPATSMSALASVCQRVQEDFDVTIDIGELADTVVPALRQGYPVAAKFSAKSFFVARIRYPAVTRELMHEGRFVMEPAKDGFLIYIKSNMIKGLAFPVNGYKAKNPDFPNQPTADQFFEPAQFEAYRQLGYVSADAFVQSLSLVNSSKEEFFQKLGKAH